MLHHESYILSEDHEWVVFLHGAGGSMRTFKRQVSAFQQSYNLLLLDIRDHGQSKNIPYKKNDFSLQLITKDVIDVMDHFNIDKAHFVSVSMGSIFVRILEEDYSERVASIILGGGVFKLDLKVHGIIRTGLFLNMFLSFHVIYKILARLVLPRKNHKKSRDIFIKEADNITQEEFGRWLHLLSEFKSTLRRLFKQPISVPTFIVMGSQDHMFIDSAKDYAAKFSNVSIKIIQKCGHVCNIEKADMFNQLSLNYLSELNQEVATQPLFDASNLAKTKDAILMRCYQSLIAFTPESIQYRDFLWLTEKLNKNILAERTKRLIYKTAERLDVERDLDKMYAIIENPAVLTNWSEDKNNEETNQQLRLSLASANNNSKIEQILIQQLLEGNFSFVFSELENIDLPKNHIDNIRYVAAIEYFRGGSVDKSFELLNSLETKLKSYSDYFNLLLSLEGRKSAIVSPF